MPKTFIILLSIVFISTASFIACTKQHLDPNPPGETEPYVYISANIQNDSVYFAGGVHSYVGSTGIYDSLTFRSFYFNLINTNHGLFSCFKISINNFKNEQGSLQTDFVHSIYPGMRHYQDTIHFIPLAATIVWYNSTGVKFTSELLTQLHLFNILSVEDITFNNKKYKKTNVEFNCNVRDEQGHILHITDGKGTLLFGIN